MTTAALDHDSTYVAWNQMHGAVRERMRLLGPGALASCTSALLCLLAHGCHDATVSVGKLPAAPERSTDAGSAPPAAADSGKPESTAQPPLVDASTVSPRPRAETTRYEVGIETGSRDEFCARSGSALVSQRADGSQATCEARVERRVFRHGLCACQELQLPLDSFLIDSFDSRQGVYVAGQTGGDVGVSGPSIQLSATTEVRGSVWVTGTGSWPLTADSLLVTGDLKTNAALIVNAGEQRVARDLWAASDVFVRGGNLRVDRDAYQARDRSGLDGAMITGEVYRAGDWQIPAPCLCGADAPIDVAALVAQAREQNDNAAASFNPTELDIQSLVSDLKPLPCGRLFVPKITLASGSTYFAFVDRRSAVFVEGDLKVASGSTLSFIPSAGTDELDLFIAGDVIVEPASTLALGNQGRPSALRVFVGGQVETRGTLALAAELYAPNATITTEPLNADSDLFGAIYTRSLKLATRRFHYDRAIQYAGQACSAPAPQSCAGCNECPEELSCATGSCQACSSDADCCEPTVCAAGRCQTLVSSWL